MEYKVTVLTPNGRRHNVKVTPNTTILQILEQACLKHGFSSDEYCLKHHNKLVPISQTFRFSGLPNNCLLEMYQTEKKRIDLPVEICVQTEDGERKQAQFVPDDNLWHVLKQLQGEVELQKLESPVILYMRQEIMGAEQLSKTTLKSLGIMEGRALLRLLDKQPEELKTQAMVYKPSVSKMSTTTKDLENNKSIKTRSTVPGGGFAITKNLIQSLQKTSSQDTEAIDNKENENNESPTSSNKKDDALQAEKPKYDWGTAPGHSMCTSKTQMEVDESENSEPEYEPEYYILGDHNALIYSLDTAQSQVEDLPDSFYDLTVHDLKLVLRDLKKIAAGTENEPIMTEKLRELEENNTMLRKIAQYKNCVIRVQFPDRHVLQGMFKPIDKISDVKEFVKAYLMEPGNPFYLFTIPPKTILDLDKTLLELDFVPNALLHFSFNDETDSTDNFIKSQFLNKLTSAEGAFYAASKLRKERYKLPNNSDGSSKVEVPYTGAIPKRLRNKESNTK